MPRGGARPGAGRKKGSKNKGLPSVAATIVAHEIAPLDVYKRVIPRLLASDDIKDLALAGQLAAKFAPYVHQRFAPTEREPTQAHELQGLPLFPELGHKPPSREPEGKKAQADAAAAAALLAPGWDDLLVRKH